MRIEYDPAKRDWTLRRRGLDFEDATIVLETEITTVPDGRADYGEDRFNTFGMLAGRLVHVTWTPRSDAVRVISMRFANERERARCVGQRR